MINLGDANSSYYGGGNSDYSQSQNSNTFGGSAHKKASNAKRHKMASGNGDANVINDDFVSQGYGNDSVMDEQDLNGFADDASDIIDEEEGGEDHNNSMDNIRASKKNKPKSLDDFDE